MTAVRTNFGALRHCIVQKLSGAWELSKTSQTPSCTNALTHAGPQQQQRLAAVLLNLLDVATQIWYWYIWYISLHLSLIIASHVKEMFTKVTFHALAKNWDLLWLSWELPWLEAAFQDQKLPPQRHVVHVKLFGHWAIPRSWLASGFTCKPFDLLGVGSKKPEKLDSILTSHTWSSRWVPTKLCAQLASKSPCSTTMPSFDNLLLDGCLSSQQPPIILQSTRSKCKTQHSNSISSPC